MKRQYMIDIETMDTAPTAAICSIGVAEIVDDEHITNRFEALIHWKDSIDYYGRTVSESTKDFWEQQSDEARKDLKGDTDLLEALRYLSRFIEKGSIVWANGTDFDLSILKNAYEKFGSEPPWDFRNTRDYRTLKKEYLELTELDGLPFINENKHSALADATHQARCLIYIKQELKRVFKDEL